MKNNSLKILETLDSFLGADLRLYIYGRSALALGYANPPEASLASMDVDAILPAAEVAAIEQNQDFWLAQERTNAELGDTGLYFTHLFEDKQVILTPDWQAKAVALSGFSFGHIKLFRPSTADLILTKMMRVDPQDRDDILFLIKQPDVSIENVREALDRAVVPPIAELEEAFRENKTWLRKIFSPKDESEERG